MSAIVNWDNNDTICAVSTPQGMGGIAVVRVSGRQAIAMVSQRWRGADLTQVQSHTAHLGHIVDTQGELLDQVVATVFRSPHSFTGEDVVEVACHGSLWIQQQLVQTLIDAGCRHATAGEFTRRAFANGKMDLSQAEAVADLIEAQSRAAHHVAINQMRGRFSNELHQLRKQLLQFVSLIELELDFSEEDVTFADRKQVTDLASRIHGMISQLADTYRQGNAIRNGLPVAIVGQTNAGKSTLLNALLNDERALVTDIHGTTRDTIEDTITMGGTLFRFIDTAGIRQSDDTVEQMGMQRSWQAVDKAAIVLWVIDAARAGDDGTLAHDIMQRCHDKQLIAVVNKTDVADPTPVINRLPADMTTIAISAHSTDDVERLRQLIVSTSALPQVDEQSVIVTNARHYQALVRAQAAIDRAIVGLNNNLSGDLVSQDIRECLHWLAEITGEITTDDILGEIFAHFCVGK